MADEDLHLVVNCRSGEGFYVPGDDREKAVVELDRRADEVAERAHAAMLAEQAGMERQADALAELRKVAAEGGQVDADLLLRVLGGLQVG